MAWSDVVRSLVWSDVVRSRSKLDNCYANDVMWYGLWCRRFFKFYIIYILKGGSSCVRTSLNQCSVTVSLYANSPYGTVRYGMVCHMSCYAMPYHTISYHIIIIPYWHKTHIFVHHICGPNYVKRSGWAWPHEDFRSNLNLVMKNFIISIVFILLYNLNNNE